MTTRETSVVLAIASAAALALGRTVAFIHGSTASTPTGTLVTDPAERMAFAQRFPILVKSKSAASGKANRMTFGSLKRFKLKVFTDAALAAIAVEFANLCRFASPRSIRCVLPPAAEPNHLRGRANGE
jgi:hypothetical protein